MTQKTPDAPNVEGTNPYTDAENLMLMSAAIISLWQEFGRATRKDVIAMAAGIQNDPFDEDVLTKEDVLRHWPDALTLAKLAAQMSNLPIPKGSHS